MGVDAREKLHSGNTPSHYGTIRFFGRTGWRDKMGTPFLPRVAELVSEISLGNFDLHVLGDRNT